MRAVQTIVLTGVIVSVLWAPPVSSHSFPTKHVRVITAGVGTFHDIVTRHLAQRLGARWSQPVVVENRATLLVGSGVAAKSSPDGYTLLMADRTSHAVYPNLYKNLPYDAARDFAPITLAVRAPLVLVAHPSLPAASLREFLAYVRQQPGAVNYANSGNGTASHIAGEELKQAAGIDMAAIQYKGGGAAMLAILSGEARVGFSVVAVALPHVKAGRVKAYVIASAHRFAGAPDIPTAAEAGLPGFESEIWIGMFAPARTAPPVIAKLNRDIVQVLRTPDMQAAMLAQGAESVPGSPEEFAAFIKNETMKMKKVIEAAGIKAE